MSLPQRDEDFLREITAELQRNPFRDLPDDDGDGYIPQLTVQQVPQRLYEDTIADLRGEIDEYRTDNLRLVTERDHDRANCKTITALYDHQRGINFDLARARRADWWRLLRWRLAALAGWALWLVALVRR